MANDNTGAEFGPQEGQIETIDPNEKAATFYIQETIVEKVVDTHQEEQEDGTMLTFAEEDEHETVRLFGPFVQAIADREQKRVEDRFKALALPGKQTVEQVPAEDIDGRSETAPAHAEEPVVTDVLKPDAPQSPEVGGLADVPETPTPDDSPSWSVTVADVPESDQTDATGITNPDADIPADDSTAQGSTSPVDAPQNSVDAITGSSTEADDVTVDPTAPPVAPTSPSVPDGPADGVADQAPGTVQETEPTIDTPATIPVETTQGDSGADQIDVEHPVTGDPIAADASDSPAPVDSSEQTSASTSDSSSSTPGDGAPADAVQNVDSPTAGDDQPVTSEDPTPAAPSDQPAIVDGPDDSLLTPASTDSTAEQATPGQG